MTGPNTDSSPIEMTGVPTSYPTRLMPSACEARTAASYSVESAAAARLAGRPASASAAVIVSASRGALSWWNRFPSAVYSGSTTSGP